MSEVFERGIQAYEAKQYNEAYKLFKEVSPSNANALMNLGLMHMKGRGCVQDTPTAMELFEKAAATGSVPAMFALGTFYEKGLHAGNIDNEKALHFYKQAADNAHVEGQLKTGLLYKQKENLAEAMRYLITDAYNNNTQAQSLITYVSNKEGATITNSAFHSLDAERQKALVANLIETQIKPILASDGGGIELVNYIAGETPQVWLSYLGACSGCHLGSTSTADMLLEHFQTMIDKNVILYLM